MHIAEDLFNFLSKIDELLPLTKRIKEIISPIVEHLSVLEDDERLLRCELISCIALAIKMLNFVMKYIESVEKCLHHACLFENDVSEIRLGYNYFMSLHNISENEVDGSWPSLTRVASTLPSEASFKGQGEEAFKHLQEYLSTLSRSCQEAVESHECFVAQSEQVIAICKSALERCSKASKLAADPTERVLLTPFAGISVGTVAGTIGAGIGGVFGPPGMVVGAALGFGSGYSMISHNIEKRYEGIAQKLNLIDKYFTRVNAIAQTCCSNMHRLKLEIATVKKGKETIDHHVYTRSSYTSFCQVVDDLQRSVDNATKALQHEQTKEHVRNKIVELEKLMETFSSQ